MVVSRKDAPSKPAQTMADKADRHELYEAAVQNVEDECAFVADTFRSVRGREARSFREDFSGTASASCEWVRRDEANSAVGVDIDSEVLEWGRRNRLSRLTEDQARRVELRQGDVLRTVSDPVDAVGAFNFSYWIFKDRPKMLQYFQVVRDVLKDDGVFFLDAFGGYEAFDEIKEKTRYDGFTYVWHQARYRPVTGELLCHIHFRFPDGSKQKKAFSYDWRLWTLPELQELLLEAGFRKVTVYWEGSDEDGDGDGEFTPEPHGEADAGWIAYLVAEK